MFARPSVKNVANEVAVDVLIVLASLRAEGTPRMALEFGRLWTAWGIRVGVLDLGRGGSELLEEFQALPVPIETVATSRAGLADHLELIGAVASVVRRVKARRVLVMPLGVHSVVTVGARVGGARVVAAHIGNPPLSGVTAKTTRIKARLLTALGRPMTHSWVCCSQYVEMAAVKQLGVPRDRTAVVYNGVHGQPFLDAGRTVGDPVDCAGRSAVVGMVGTLEGHKDQATLIRAAAQIFAEGQELQVQLVGDGARRAHLQALIDQLGAPVELLGSSTDVAPILAGLDVFVFSTSSEEGLGIALIEAMVAGVPVIASDVPACREVLDGGALGVLVPPGDAEALSAAIVGVLALPRAAARRAEAARKKALTVFAAETMARRYAEILGLQPPASAMSGCM